LFGVSRPNGPTTGSTPSNIDLKLGRHRFNSRNVDLPLPLGVVQHRRLLTIRTVQGRGYVQGAVYPFRLGPECTLPVPFPSFSPSSLWIALRLSPREWRGLSFGGSLELFVLLAESVDFSFQILNPPVALFNPSIAFRDLAPQLEDFLLLLVFYAHSHTQPQFTPIRAVNNYLATAA
jgi:hypothetical protein